MHLQNKSGIYIGPSILSADFSHLAEEIRRVEQTGADLIHIDIMDGHFVPNLTFGPKIVGTIRKLTRLPLDVHLMITNPEKLIPSFIDQGADHITFHYEVTAHPSALIKKIRKFGLSAGLAVNPGTSLRGLVPFLPDINLALLMTVNPGFGAQKLITQVIPKIRTLHNIVKKKGCSTKIQVDGGINHQTAPVVISAGARILVAGHYIFSSPDYKQAVTFLRRSL